MLCTEQGISQIPRLNYFQNVLLILTRELLSENENPRILLATNLNLLHSTFTSILSVEAESGSPSYFLATITDLNMMGNSKYQSQIFKMVFDVGESIIVSKSEPG